MRYNPRMAILGWLGGHWFDLLQTTSFVVGLVATVHTIRADTRERKIANLFAITAAHRDLWAQFYQQPALHRILETGLDLEKHPPTLMERRFVHELILHLRASFKARNAGMQFDDDAVAADIRQFFARPIPRAVWEQSRLYQDRAFIAFIERCIEPLADVKRAA